MTYQRRRGLPAVVYRTKVEVDNRGNSVVIVDEENPHAVKVWTFPQRGAKAEVPGQQHINVTRIGTNMVEGVDLWSRVEFMGKTWDVVSPPSYHHGNRHTRHWSIDIRERTGG